MQIMPTEHPAIVKLLRCQMTAVHQQFVHILSLRHLGDHLRADRIYEVDKQDFVNVLHMMDFIVQHAPGIEFPTELPQPGEILAGLFEAELRIEAEIAARILACKHSNPFRLRAIAARLGYNDWLHIERRKLKLSVSNMVVPDAIGSLCFSLLIAVVEQTLFHAFVHHHDNQSDRANRSWAISGAAMLKLTELIKAFADLGSMPIGLPKFDLKIAASSSESVKLDRQLLENCTMLMSEVDIESMNNKLAPSTISALTFFKAVSCWDRVEPDPAYKFSSQAFHNFQKMRHKFKIGVLAD
jgi:hypothetical protein